MKNDEIKRALARVPKECSTAPSPKTSCTPLMFNVLVNELLPAGATGKQVSELKLSSWGTRPVSVSDCVPARPGAGPAARFILRRSRTLACCEGVGGCRVGDATGADDTHGLVAPNVSLLSHPTLGQSVELELDDSKTGFPRTVTMAGTTKGSGTKVYEAFEEYLAAAGFAVATRQEGEYTIRQPVTYVYRVLLSTMDAQGPELARLMSTLEHSGENEVTRHLATTRNYASRRAVIKDNCNRAYVNVAEGTAECALFGRLRSLLDSAGFVGLHFEAPAPFIRATRGASITLMPLGEASTYRNFIDLLPAAEAIVRQRSPDPYFDLADRSESSYGNHSLRQMADRVARRTRSTTGVSEEDIDAMFGWNEAAVRKRQQLHYEGRAERAKLARITEFV